jgi:hypothetical protein
MSNKCSICNDDGWVDINDPATGAVLGARDCPRLHHPGHAPFNFSGLLPEKFTNSVAPSGHFMYGPSVPDDAGSSGQREFRVSVAAAVDNERELIEELDSPVASDACVIVRIAGRIVGWGDDYGTFRAIKDSGISQERGEALLLAAVGVWEASSSPEPGPKIQDWRARHPGQKKMPDHKHVAAERARMEAACDRLMHGHRLLPADYRIRLKTGFKAGYLAALTDREPLAELRVGGSSLFWDESSLFWDESTETRPHEPSPPEALDADLQNARLQGRIEHDRLTTELADVREDASHLKELLLKERDPNEPGSLAFRHRKLAEQVSAPAQTHDYKLHGRPLADLVFEAVKQRLIAEGLASVDEAVTNTRARAVVDSIRPWLAEVSAPAEPYARATRIENALSQLVQLKHLKDAHPEHEAQRKDLKETAWAEAKAALSSSTSEGER